jgi:hypothetical protein
MNVAVLFARPSSYRIALLAEKQCGHGGSSVIPYASGPPLNLAADENANLMLCCLYFGIYQ